MFRSLLPLLIAALPGVCLPTIAAAEEQLALFSTDGYRIGLYRSPTPDQLQGATIVDTPALQALLGLPAVRWHHHARIAG